jgi:hypothetical protein
MQAAQREDVATIWIGPEMRLELPKSILARSQAVLGPLFDGLFAPEAPSLSISEAPAGNAPLARVERGPDGWRLEHGRFWESVASDEELLLRLQEIGLEALARRRHWLLFRGSVVTRGSQSVLIVGDQGEAHVLLAVALMALEFRPVSIERAAFDVRPPRGCPEPLPLPLAFGLSPEDQASLEALPHPPDEHLVSLSPTLFRACRVTAAPEPTHILFLDAPQDSRSLLRPIAATTARSRLCGAVTVAPDDPPPFAAVAALLRPARGIHLPIGDLSQTLEQLARLLPRWNVP